RACRLPDDPRRAETGLPAGGRMNSELFNYSLKTLQVLNVVADLVLSVALFGFGYGLLNLLEWWLA
ncbi:hypothetical protein NL301_27090, partial [Klebsiella pneumoniae]|nr:hypothetical protein [Klebsiella pneumoniae]